jgi:hypothetical protein
MVHEKGSFAAMNTTSLLQNARRMCVPMRKATIDAFLLTALRCSFRLPQTRKTFLASATS